MGKLPSEIVPIIIGSIPRGYLVIKSLTVPHLIRQIVINVSVHTMHYIITMFHTLCIQMVNVHVIQTGIQYSAAMYVIVINEIRFATRWMTVAMIQIRQGVSGRHMVNFLIRMIATVLVRGSVFLWGVLDRGW